MPWRDLMLAARSLRKSPSFAFTAVVMIAAGTGAVALMFSVMNSVLLRPLPYKDPERLVVAYGDLRARANFGAPLSNENFVDIAADAKDLFQELAAVRTGTMILTGPDGGREQVRFGQATPNLFRTLGAGIAAGRDFEEADGQPQTGPAEAAALPNMVILSYEYWRRRYGGDRAMLGRSLDGGPGRSDRIVGVLAPGFELLFAPADNVELRPDVWFAGRPVYNNANRNTFSLRPIGRLRRGVTVERAQAAVESTASHIRRDYTNYSASDFHARLEPMHKALVAQVRPTVLVLMGSVSLLFLIACANVLNLMLVRSSLRVREMAVRAALGSGMWPLVRLSLAEALILTAAGTAAGVMLARTGLRSLLAVAPANLPRAEEIRLDPIVLAVTAFAGLVAATALGLLPTWAVFRGDIMKVLRGTSRTAGLSGGGKMRSVVLVVEVDRKSVV